MNKCLSWSRPILIFLLVVNTPQAMLTAQESKPPGENSIRLILQLNEKAWESLTTTGQAKAAVSDEQQGKIVAIQLATRKQFLSEPHPVQATTSAANGVLSIELTDHLIRLLEFQPIEIMLPETRFSSILLNNVAITESGENSTPTPSGNSGSNKGTRFFVRNTNDQGRFVRLLDDIVFSTRLGRLSVPVEQVSAVHFKNSQDIRVYFANGDKISGTFKEPSIRVATEWGLRRIPVAELFSITKRREHAFLPMKPDQESEYLLFDTAVSQERRKGY